MNQQQALEEVRGAIEQHGRPYWLGFVSKRVRDLATPKEINAILEASGANPRATKSSPADAILEWCKGNVFAEVSVKELAGTVGCHEDTARATINNRPDVFWKVGWGKWEVRDPEADRRHDKRGA